jgi:hypothetical protein
MRDSGLSFDQARATDLELLMRSVVDSGHGWHLCTPEIKCIMSTYVGQVYEGPISLSVTNMPSFSRCVIIIVAYLSSVRSFPRTDEGQIYRLWHILSTFCFLFFDLSSSFNNLEVEG